MVKNAFFDLALKRASRMLGNKQRLLLLLGKMSFKLRDVEWNQLSGENVKGRFMAVARMFKAFVCGRYTNVPVRTMLLITATIIYFVSPIDLVPDLLLGIGFTDDFAILLMVYNSLQSELDKFISWEKSQVAEI